MDSEDSIRLIAFLGVLAVMALWEAIAPRRSRSLSRVVRWPNNLGVAALNVLMVRIAIPLVAVDFAGMGELESWGLFNNLPHRFDAYLPWSAIIPAVILLDLAIYFQHVMFHAVPALWRFHRMHHADLDLDVTSGARFHPGEIAISLMVKIAAVVVIGAPPEAVIIFEVALNATSMFNHSNVYIAERIDRMLRWVTVTPDMHRIHHSIERIETNSNFGFNLSWWDRILGTYRKAPAAGQRAMVIGIEQFRAPREAWLDRMLLQPFRGEPVGYPFNES